MSAYAKAIETLRAFGFVDDEAVELLEVLDKMACQVVQHEVQLTVGSKTVTAWTSAMYPGLLVHPTPGLGDWTITHASSGRRVVVAATPPEAARALALLAEDGVDWTRPLDQISSDVAAKVAVTRTIHALGEAVAS